MGVAGDMLMGALYDVCPEEVKEDYIDTMNRLLPDVRVVAEQVDKSGILGTHMRVLVHGEEEMSHDYHALEQEQSSDHDHEHDHNHDHNHEHNHEHDHHHDHTHESHFHHSHHTPEDVYAVIRNMDLPQEVRRNAEKVYACLAQAEAKAHGKEIPDIHFHEVGTKDALIDVVGTCWLIDRLKVDRIIAGPIRTGYGNVHCAHGILPVPAPATAYILEDIPWYAGDIEGELCTPTGAAILKVFVNEFGQMPVMKVKKVGYGMGTKEFQILNCVRAFIGETEEKDSVLPNGSVVELACNIDDMTPEELGFAVDIIRENGALEVYVTPVQMKKNRAGWVLSVLCKEEQEADYVKLMLKHTSTIGIRRRLWERYELKRSFEEIDTPYGIVKVKAAKGYGVEKRKAEYDELSKIAKEQDISIRQLKADLKESGIDC